MSAVKGGHGHLYLSSVFHAYLPKRFRIQSHYQEIAVFVPAGLDGPRVFYDQYVDFARLQA
jgi:hypothetical protein